MKIVTVIPLKKGKFPQDLTYFTSKDIPIGSIVDIPIRSKQTLGLVVSAEDVSSAKGNIKEMDFNLKKITEVKENSIFRKEYLESALEVSRYFIASKNNTVTSLIPAIFREKYDEIASTHTPKSVETGEKNKIKSEKLLFQNSFEDRISSYKTLIRESFALKKSVYIVLPTERDIQKFDKMLSRGIEQFTFAMHGGLGNKKILQNYKNITSIPHPVLMLGTAPFLSIPRYDIGSIILEHESSHGYKMITRPHLDLRIFVELFASKINTRFILSDTLLSFETIERNEKDSFVPMSPLSYRINFKGTIDILGKNMLSESDQKSDKKFKILSDQTVEEIREVIAKKKNVFLFTLRKGLATQTICRNCNETINCDRCHAPVVLYTSRNGKNRIFSCNRCKRELDPNMKCGNCGSWDLVPLGIGTDTVYEELKRLLGSKVKVFKLDKESAKTQKGAEKLAREFEANTGAILVGTEMALSYLENKVTMSVIASFDSLWSIPNFKMSEKVIQLIFSIITQTENKFIIETKNNEDPAILAVEQENLLSFIREELKTRKALGYPPFKRFIKITHLGARTETEEIKEKLAYVFKEYEPEIFSGFVAKLKDKYVTNALIRIDPHKWSLPEIKGGSTVEQNLFEKLSLLPSDFSVIVDPEDLL